jgi:hypothetical protein
MALGLLTQPNRHNGQPLNLVLCVYTTRKLSMSLMEVSQVFGNIGEFVGSIAVLATLIYLTVQVRHSRELLEENRKLALSQVFQTRSDAKLSLHLQATTEPLATALAKARAIDFKNLVDIPDEFTDTEIQCLGSYQTAWATHTDNVAYQTELELMDEETINIAATAMSQGQAYRELLGVELTPRVIRFVEKYKVEPNA